VPTSYTIFNAGKAVATVSGAAHSYLDAGLAPEMYYRLWATQRAADRRHLGRPRARMIRSIHVPAAVSMSQRDPWRPMTYQ